MQNSGTDNDAASGGGGEATSPSADPSRQQHPVEVSPIDEKDRHDLELQQIIDDLARVSRGRPHERVVAELAEKIDEQNLPAKPQPWLDAVAAEVVTGNAYVVTATTARVSDVPQPNIDRSGETLE